MSPRTTVCTLSVGSGALGFVVGRVAAELRIAEGALAGGGGGGGVGMGAVRGMQAVVQAAEVRVVVVGG